MSNKNLIIVERIIEYCKRIIKYCDDYSFEQFQTDDKTINACALILIQIGESVNKLDDDFTEMNKHIPWHQIRAIRNRITHNYEDINMKIVWNIIQSNIPELINQLKEFLK
jgi:uncharacterized protein with HEPN domain